MCVFLVAYVSINTGIHKDTFRCTCVFSCILYVRVSCGSTACFGLFLFIFLQSRYMHLSERCHREPLTPLIQCAGENSSFHTTRPQTHNLISSLRQYEWHNSTWMRASAVICRCDLNDLIIFMSDRFGSRAWMQGELHQRYQVNWYSGGSKSASFLLFKRLLARRILDFLTELHC